MTSTTRYPRAVRVGAAQLPARSIQQSEQAFTDMVEGVYRLAEAGAELAVLPECSWPGYFVGSRWHPGNDGPGESTVRQALSEAASRTGMVLVVGLGLAAHDSPDGPLRNVAVVYERDGSEAAQVHKRFLWDFDHRWSSPGAPADPVRTSVGTLGVFVCADGRMPEIARQLALSGAELLVDPTAWVTPQDDPATWSNPQFEHMLPTRAWENGLWAVAANKVGIERQAVAYCGRSCVVNEAGDVVVAAPPDKPETVIADAVLRSSEAPTERRPTAYAPLVRPTDRLPVTKSLDQPLIPAQASRRIALAATEPDEDVLHAAADLGAALVVLPQAPTRSPTALASPVPTLVRRDEHTVELSTPTEASRLFRSAHHHTHERPEPPPVVSTPLGAVSVLVEEDGFPPEYARAAMLDGAEVLVWFPPTHPDLGSVAATRALENRVYLVLAGSHDTDSGAAIFDPNGTRLVSARTQPRVLVTNINLAEARRKEMAPGTDVVLGRDPESYHGLVSNQSG